MSAYNKIPALGDSPGKALIAVEWTVVLLMLVSLVLRFSARKIQGQRPSFDDWACVFASVFVILLTVLGTIAVSLAGLGLISGLNPASVALTFKLYAPKEICWSFANTSVKLSFLAFFRRVFSLQQYRKRFYVAGILTIALGLGNLIQCLAMCRPFEYFWDKSIPGGVCGNQDLALLLVACFSVLVDIAIFSLPVPILRKLNVSRRKRRQLISVFSLGICITIIPIIRVFLTIPLWRDPERTDWWVCIIEIFYQLELSLAVIAACVPTWKPLIRHLSANRANLSKPSYQRSNYGRRKSITGSNQDDSRLVPLSDISIHGSQIRAMDRRQSEDGTPHTEAECKGQGLHDTRSEPVAPPEEAQATQHNIIVTTSWDVSSKARKVSQTTINV